MGSNAYIDPFLYAYRSVPVLWSVWGRTSFVSGHSPWSRTFERSTNAKQQCQQLIESTYRKHIQSFSPLARTHNTVSFLPRKSRPDVIRPPHRRCAPHSRLRESRTRSPLCRSDERHTARCPGKEKHRDLVRARVDLRTARFMRPGREPSEPRGSNRGSLQSPCTLQAH